MAPPLTSTNSQSQFDEQQLYSPKGPKAQQDQLEYLSSQPLSPLHEEPGDEPSVEPTQVTITTDVDPHQYTITTTTIVHLPFQVSSQCPPPKVVSWMKSRRPSTTRSRKTTPQHRHHPHQRQTSSPNILHHILPFFYKRRGSVEAAKKGDRAVTVFSIQVTVLGRVLVPPSPAPVAPSTEQQQDENGSSSSSHSSSSNNSLNMELDLSPTKSVPAQLNRTQTTSYVIHRTFDDFERLSEMVLRLEHALHAHHHLEHEQHQDIHDEDGPVTPTDGPALRALSMHHPHPGLYQALLKQFSKVKANQRAFDASSTTHGFHEEGAFERVLELNQYLENVWYWLMPEHTPPQLDLSAERHEIMQWLKPLQNTALADGRQMKERPIEENPHQSIFLQQYGSMRRPEKGAQVQQQAETATDMSTETDSEESVATVTPTTPQETLHAGRAKNGAGAPEKSSSQVSLPSLSSSPSSSASSHGQDNQNDDINDEAVPESLRTMSTVTSSTLMPPGTLKDGPPRGESHSGKKASDTIIDTTAEISELKDVPLVPRAGHRRGDLSIPLSDTKVKRRISISNVFRSLSLPRGNHTRHMSMYETGHKKGSTSPSVPASPTFQEEIVVWNTVTIKNPPGGFGRP